MWECMRMHITFHTSCHSHMYTTPHVTRTTPFATSTTPQLVLPHLMPCNPTTPHVIPIPYLISLLPHIVSLLPHQMSFPCTTPHATPIPHPVSLIPGCTSCVTPTTPCVSPTTPHDILWIYIMLILARCMCPGDKLLWLCKWQHLVAA